jgi:hypothetical protein
MCQALFLKVLATFFFILSHSLYGRLPLIWHHQGAQVSKNKGVAMMREEPRLHAV